MVSQYLGFVEKPWVLNIIFIAAAGGGHSQEGANEEGAAAHSVEGHARLGEKRRHRKRQEQHLTKTEDVPAPRGHRHIKSGFPVSKVAMGCAIKPTRWTKTAGAFTGGTAREWTQSCGLLQGRTVEARRTGSGCAS